MFPPTETDQAQAANSLQSSAGRMPSDWAMPMRVLAEALRSPRSSKPIPEAGEATKPTNDGFAFQREIGAVLVQAGYNASFTPATGDQGVDLIAEAGGERIAIQCKDYTSAVGNDAVQQVFSGGAFYRTQRCVVVAPRGFTSSALQLANSLGVVCVGPSELVLALGNSRGVRLEKGA
jgi:HJR/Mrr/RecB family endonuclease